MVGAMTRFLPLTFLILLFMAAALASPCEIVAQGFAPGDDLEAIDIALLSRARRAVDIAAYVLTDIPVIDALGDAAGRGARVRLYRDGRAVHAPKLLREALDRLAARPNVEVRYKASPAPFMHLKAYAIDGEILRTGAGNFTRTGLRRQDNDLVALRCPQAVDAFEKAFHAMWGR
jgi:phosphatidylserine/phosphatidylglycerophosphate/cardiolipin synthase-like enzyme